MSADLTATAPAPPSTPRLLRDLLAAGERHRYGPHRSNRADLYVPAGDGPHPVV